MSAARADEKPNILISILQNKCPRCRRGRMYKFGNTYNLKNFMVMNERCPECSQVLDMEPGFYYGTNMVSYSLAVLISVASFFIWWLTIGFSLSDSRFFWWLGVNAILLVALQPPLMRISRTIWIYFFVPYSSKWQEGDVIHAERVNKDQMNAW